MPTERENVSAETGASVPRNPPRENLIRATHDDGALSTRDEGSSDMPVLVGHAAVFNQWTEINSAFEGRFMERIAPGAFAKTIGENRDRIKVLFQHGKDPQIGDKPLGPLRSIEEDSKGLRYEVPLLDTSYNRDLVPGLKAGLYGASFRFSVLRDNVKNKPPKSEYNPRGLPERTVEELRMPELGPVTFGAYASATAGLRSMTDEFLFDALTEDPERLELLARRSGISLAGVNVPFAAEFDNDDVAALARMTLLATKFIGRQDANDAGDGKRVAAMKSVVATLSELTRGEAAATVASEETVDERAVWTTAYIDDLPDSAFLCVEDGGTKDGSGKTIPRSLRHFPYKDASGAVDLPHLRNALARIPQSDLPQSVKDETTAKAEKILAAQSGRSEEPGASERTTRTPGTEPGSSAATTRDKDRIYAGLNATRKEPRGFLD